jgi:hypothetical protein
MKRFFKVMAVEEPRTFGIILARIMPLHINTNNVAQKYLTEEQMRARLREAGLPEGLIDFMRPVDARKLDPNEISRPNPYPDPEDETDDQIARGWLAGRAYRLHASGRCEEAGP